MTNNNNNAEFERFLESNTQAENWLAREKQMQQLGERTKLAFSVMMEHIDNKMKDGDVQGAIACVRQGLELSMLDMRGAPPAVQQTNYNVFKMMRHMWYDLGYPASLLMVADNGLMRLAAVSAGTTIYGHFTNTEAPYKHIQT